MHIFTGAIGIINPISEQLYNVLLAIQTAISKVIQGVGGLQFNTYAVRCCLSVLPAAACPHGQGSGGWPFIGQAKGGFELSGCDGLPVLMALTLSYNYEFSDGPGMISSATTASTARKRAEDTLGFAPSLNVGSSQRSGNVSPGRTGGILQWFIVAVSPVDQLHGNESSKRTGSPSTHLCWWGSCMHPCVRCAHPLPTYSLL